MSKEQLLVETAYDGISAEVIDLPVNESTEEDTPQGKRLFLSGIFMEAETRNINGRVYDRDEMMAQMQRINEAAARKHHVLGELDHPNKLVVDIRNVSHRLMEMEMKDNRVFGKAEILPTPMGNIARTLIEADVQLGVSSRGAGSVNEADGRVNNYRLITVDIVANPSARTAYPQALRESVENYQHGTRMMDLAEAVKHDNAAQKYLTGEVRKFFSDLLDKQK